MFTFVFRRFLFNIVMSFVRGGIGSRVLLGGGLAANGVRGGTVGHETKNTILFKIAAHSCLLEPRLRCTRRLHKSAMLLSFPWRAFDVQRIASVTEDSTAIVWRADEEQPVIAWPGWLATEDGQWSTASVSTIKGEKVSFHRVASEALRATTADLDGALLE